MSFLGMEDWYNRMVVCRLWWRPGLRPLGEGLPGRLGPKPASCSPAPPPGSLSACRTSPGEPTHTHTHTHTHTDTQAKGYGDQTNDLCHVVPMKCIYIYIYICLMWMERSSYHLHLQVHHLLVQRRLGALNLLDPLGGDTPRKRPSQTRHPYHCQTPSYMYDSCCVKILSSLRVPFGKTLWGEQAEAVTSPSC